MSPDKIADLRNQIVTADWMRGRPLWEIKEDAKLAGLGGEDVMDVVRALQLPERHCTTGKVLEPHIPVGGEWSLSKHRPLVAN